MKHTPTPWVMNVTKKHVEDTRGLAITNTDGSVLIASVNHDLVDKHIDEYCANAERIVACVNALEGIEDPAAYMNTANDLILKGGEAMNKLELMQKLVDQYKIKADKWDALENELLKCYERFDDEDNELPSEHEEETGEEANLMTIGEICIKHFELF